MSFWSKPGKAMKSFFGGSKPPAPLTSLPGGGAAPAFPVPNIGELFDVVSGSNIRIVRSVDGKLSVYSNGAPLVSAPINTRNVNTAFPDIREVRGGNIRDIRLREAATVITLSNELQRLSQTVAQMEVTSPELVQANQQFLNSFKNAQQRALDKGFDIQQNGLANQLAKLGLSKSDTALGAQIALARERADAQARVDLEYYGLAQQLKQQTIDTMFKRGEQIANNANVELNKFGIETGNELQARAQDLQAREQDINAQLSSQELALRRAEGIAAQDQANADRELQAEMARRQLIAQESQFNRGLTADLFKNSSDQALGARSVDNQALSNLNQSKLQSYSLQSNPFKELFMTGAGAIAGGFGQRVGSRIANKFFPEPVKKEI